MEVNRYTEYSESFSSGTVVIQVPENFQIDNDNNDEDVQIIIKMPGKTFILRLSELKEISSIVVTALNDKERPGN